MTADHNSAALHLWRNMTMRVLVRMLENGASPEMCLTHKGIGSYLPRHALSAALRDLKDLGFVFFAKGLWSDDGEMAGAGHGLTAKGMKAAQIILARETRLKTAGPLTDDGGMIAVFKAAQVEIVRPQAALDVRKPQSARKSFPILASRGVTIDWQLVADHGEQARKNHYQSVERLAERGGLSWVELYAVLHNMPWQKMDVNDAITACRALEATYLAALEVKP